MLYSYLSPEDKEIRLLRLLPGNEDIIEAELHIVSLNTNPSYEALSYCWGFQGEKESINLNGQAVTVSKNLCAALLRLRHTQSTRILWIDALCINQTNVEEKKLQVAMMGEIYSQTDRGLIWLGDQPETPEPTVSKKQEDEIAALLRQSDDLLKSIAPILHGSGEELPPELAAALRGEYDKPSPDSFVIETTKAFDWLAVSREDVQSLSADPELRKDSVFHAFCLFRMLANDQHLTSIPYLVVEPEDAHTILTNARRAAHYILTRPWFQRIWTVQECVLPKYSILMYGPVKASWRMLMDAAENFHVHRTTCCANLAGVNDSMNILIEALGDISKLNRDRKDGLKISLEYLLRIFRRREATDLRDKIYGLLALVTNWYQGSPVIADYESTTHFSQVYTTTVLQVIEASKSLDILCQPAFVVKDYASLLPSWVPDYSQRPWASEAAYFSQQLHLYNACGTREASIRNIENDVLVLEAHRITTLREGAMKMLSQFEEPKREVFLDWLQFVKEREDKLDSNWKQHFWRTLCGDCVADHPNDFAALSWQNNDFRRAKDEDQVSFNVWAKHNNLEELCLEHLPVDTSFDNNLKNQDIHNIGSVAYAIRTSTYGKRIFISGDGHIGLAPAHAALIYSRPDEVFIIPGAKTLFVLRPVGARHIPGIGMKMAYEMIGDCYLHGFMDGQGMVDFDERKETIYLV